MLYKTKNRRLTRINDYGKGVYYEKKSVEVINCTCIDCINACRMCAECGNKR